jgi:hypothetical protein
LSHRALLTSGEYREGKDGCKEKWNFVGHAVAAGRSTPAVFGFVDVVGTSSKTVK